MQQAVPQMISKVAVKLENTCNQLRKKLGQSVETEIDGLNSLLTQQDQVCFFFRSLLFRLILNIYYLYLNCLDICISDILDPHF